jgi:hypothetical protein
MRAGAEAVLEALDGKTAVLEEVRAEASINDLLAEVTVTQRYRNPEDGNIEADFEAFSPRYEARAQHQGIGELGADHLHRHRQLPPASREKFCLVTGAANG